MQIRPENVDSLNYERMHDWLRRNLGKASEYPCDECGDTEHKHSWAFNHEYTGDVRKGITNIRGERRTVQWSPDPEAYQPLCNRCHYRRDGFDGRTLRGVPKTAEHRARMSAARKGKTQPWMKAPKSAEHRAKIGAGNARRSPELRARIAHTRWHTNRGVMKPGCTFCEENN